MAHFAKLDENNIVIAVHVVNNKVIANEDGTESEAKGILFLNTLHGRATWVQTSYNNNFRKNYACVGYTYDFERNAFIPPRPYMSWLLNEETCQLGAPIIYPDVDNKYTWDEEEENWSYVGPALPE